MPSRRHRWPATFWIGLFWILACETLLFYDVLRTGRGAIHSDDEFRAVLATLPSDAFGRFARWVAVNMTPLVWPGYIVLLEGVLTMQTAGASPVRRRPHHFAALSLASVFIWCVFDAINFNGGMGAWRYIGMPAGFWDRAWGYLLAFLAIVPGMLMSGQVLLNARLFDFARTRPWLRMPPVLPRASVAVGAAMFVWPLVHRNPVTNLTLWTSLVFLLDPINWWLGRPSIFRDWCNGWYGRTLALFAGGLACGLLWEFWNYWALAKWTYHLPFLGTLEHVRYFEMPVIGLLGFLPFGVECWVMWQTIRIPLDGLAEPLPDERQLL